MTIDNYYIPLEESPGGFAYNYDLANLIVPDDDDIAELEAQFARNFTLIQGTVIINGATYNNCVILKPNEGIDDKHYIRVNKDGIPDQLGEITGARPPAEWINENMLEVRNSEFYYYQYFTHLDNNYITPYLETSNDISFPLLDYSHILNTPKLLIVGGPGVGKTTFIRKLAYYLLKKLDKARKPGLVPVYIKLRSLNFSLNELAISHFLKETYSKMSLDVAHQTITQKRFLLLFDGLDEIEPKYQEIFTFWLKEHVLNNERYQVIITSREISMLQKNEFDSFKRLKIAPFNLSQMKEYCYKVTSEKNTRNFFFHSIEKNPDLEKILSNPLILSLALRLYLDKNILPNDITSLVKEIVDHLCENWDLNRKIKRYNFLTSSLTRTLLSKISYFLHTNEKVLFYSDEIEHLLPYKLTAFNVKDILEEISEATGLLTPESDNYWTFSHIFFQDFFCANYLIDKSSSVIDDFAKFKGNYKWINVWNNLISMSSDPEFYMGDHTKSEYEKSLRLIRMTTLFRKSDYLDSALYHAVLDQMQSLIENYSHKIKSINYGSPVIDVILNDPSTEDINILWYILCMIVIKNHEMPTEHFKNSLFKGDSEFVKLMNLLLSSSNDYLLDKTDTSIQIVKE
ncbi:NACHT domain-containing protein [Mucilaginibacter sp. R-33]|uniref:NACHT domain-containing protein n=1 Tax=Mucilaginibacter sp. R-33 TaxID=3416711 RepID=UPI003CEDB3A9